MESHILTDKNNEKLGAFPYVIGGLSFIPLIGILFGIISIIWGIFTKKTGGKKLIIIGTIGISVTVLAYGGLFYFGFVQRGGVYDDLRTGLAKSSITQLAQAIEFHKVQHGNYPLTLEELKNSLPKDNLTFIIDPSIVGVNEELRNFYYELNESKTQYYLLGVGADRQPFTADDILPTITIEEGSKLGIKFYPN